MKSIRMMTASVLLSWSAVVLAHAHLVKAVPADGSTITAVPSKFVLTFSEPARLTVLSLQKDAEPARKLGPLPPVPTAEISIPAPPLAAGKYVLSWRAVGGDGHVVPGQVSFAVELRQ